MGTGEVGSHGGDVGGSNRPGCGRHSSSGRHPVVAHPLGNSHIILAVDMAVVATANISEGATGSSSCKNLPGCTLELMDLIVRANDDGFSIRGGAKSLTAGGRCSWLLHSIDDGGASITFVLVGIEEEVLVSLRHDSVAVARVSMVGDVSTLHDLIGAHHRSSGCVHPEILSGSVHDSFESSIVDGTFALAFLSLSGAEVGGSDCRGGGVRMPFASSSGFVVNISLGGAVSCVGNVTTAVAVFELMLNGVATERASVANALAPVENFEVAGAI